MRASIWLAALPLVGGCYLSHGLPTDPERPSDAGAPAPFPDAGARPLVDSGAPAPRDAGAPFFADAAPLPDDEPDVAPGERPSDDPASGTWMDPPPPSSSPCCEVGTVIGLDDPTRQGTPPRVAWEGTEWGVAWSDLAAPSFPGDPPRAIFRRLGADAHPTTSARVLDVSDTFIADLAYGNHRFAVAMSAVAGFRDVRTGALWVIDRDGGVRAGRLLPDGLSAAVVARHPIVHGWAMIARAPDPEGDTSTDAELLVMGDDMTFVARHSLGRVGDGDGSHPTIVSMKSLVVAAIGLPDSTRVHTFMNAAIEPAAVVETGPIGIELAAAPFRDRVVIAGRGYETGPVRVAVWDPFAREFAVPPREIGGTTSGQGLAIAADQVGGTLGLCLPAGGAPSRDADAIRFVLLDPGGAPLGEPVTIATGFRYVASCTVAAAGIDRYVVLWWNAAWDSPRHSILAASVRVRR